MTDIEPFESPAVAALSVGAAAGEGPTDRQDLDRILADDADIDAARQAIADRHVLDAHPAVQLALSRMAGLTEQLAVEVRFILRHIGEA
jgi:hypothetical protein